MEVRLKGCRKFFRHCFPRDVEEEFQLCEKDYVGQNLDETLSVIEQGDSSDEADSGESDLLTQEVVDSEALDPSDQ